MIPLLFGELAIPLETLPRDGHVAYTVWPCSSFLINSIAGWRLRSLEHRLDAGSLENIQHSSTAAEEAKRIASHMESWNSLDDAAKRIILQRSRWSQLMNGIRVVDLGSGTGVVAVALNALGADLAIATDMPKCMELLESNVASWNKQQPKCRGVLAATALAWERYLAGDLNKILHLETSSSMDLVIACDCVYGTEHIGRSPIVPIVTDFLLSDDPSLGAKRLVLVAYESRDDDIEESFWYQIDQHDDIERLQVTSCAAAVSEGNEKASTTYQIFAIFRKR